MKSKKYFSLHAHFYQPPRENPWTGEIGFQDSAFPYDNWNNRIFMECYLPNLYGRIKNYKNETIEIVNNYEYMNFNFGPTLLTWLENEYPHYYRMIIETAKSVKEKSGFSNAIAQGYNHTILPLDNFSNKMLQILWGIKDFEKRFGFYPEGFWLPETAVNEDTLKILIDHKIKYVILAPYQITDVRDLKTGNPVIRRDCSPCLFYDKTPEGKKIKDRYIAIFTYDGELSRKVAFEDVLKDSSHFAQEISLLYRENENTPSLVLLASDGETYGHHKKFADMTLSHSFKYELEKRGIETLSLSKYLSMYPPQYECSINNGPDMEGTAWSCSHGVRRWKGGCPCGDEGKYDTTWRTPLRSAMQWISSVAVDIYLQYAPEYFENPEKAEQDCVELLAARDKNSMDNFLNLHLKKDSDTSKAIKLLELRKYSMFVFTSCAWFFNDISRIETRQNLAYAARISELAAEFGFRGIDRVFASIIEMARSNFKEFSDGKKIYENEILTQSMTVEKAVSYLALKTFFSALTERRNPLFTIKITGTRRTTDGLIINCEALRKDTLGNLTFEVTFMNTLQNPFLIILRNVSINSEMKFKISDYPKDIQKELLSYAICVVKTENIDLFEKIFYFYSAIINSNSSINFESFKFLSQEVKFLFSEIAATRFKLFMLDKTADRLESLKNICSYALKTNINCYLEMRPDIAALLPAFSSYIYEKNVSQKELEDLYMIVNSLGLKEFMFHIENRILENKSKGCSTQTS